MLRKVKNSGAFIADFERFSQIFTIPIVNFEQVNVYLASIA